MRSIGEDKENLSDIYRPYEAIIHIIIVPIDFSPLLYNYRNHKMIVISNCDSNYMWEGNLITRYCMNKIIFYTPYRSTSRTTECHFSRGQP